MNLDDQSVSYQAHNSGVQGKNNAYHNVDKAS